MKVKEHISVEMAILANGPWKISEDQTNEYLDQKF